VNNLLEQYENAVKQITVFFGNKYFGKDYIYDLTDWIGEEIGVCICIGDYYYFSLSNMIDFLKYKYSKKDMFDYYDYTLEEMTKGNSPVCIRDWKKLNKGSILK